MNIDIVIDIYRCIYIYKDIPIHLFVALLTYQHIPSAYFPPQVRKVGESKKLEGKLEYNKV